MQQYHQLLKDIKEKGTLKPAAREGMPSTISLFGYQMRFSLQEGFPLVTTKKMSFKNIVTELLWFLKGDTNIKFLVDRGCNIWTEDAYNYYEKVCKKQRPVVEPMTFYQFTELIKDEGRNLSDWFPNYTLGDCGKQYGWLWRNWYKETYLDFDDNEITEEIDQLEELIEGLKSNPMGRRHIITAWNPASLDDMALNACHAFVQWNCRPIPWEEKLEMAKRHPNVELENLAITEAAAGNPNYGPIPQYYLDCQMYQRSADAVLGVPYNIASYALLTEILCKICNMIPGEFIHTFGDVHIYENHLPAVEEQLQREPLALPKLNINTEFWKTETGECGIGNLDPYTFLSGLNSPDFINCLFEDIQLLDYKHQGKLVNETKLFTGLK